jgi:hypothetical protein
VRQFRYRRSAWRDWCPPRLQALASPPSMVQDDLVGRIELVIGRLGYGKTTWAATRARRLARAYGPVSQHDAEVHGGNRCKHLVRPGSCVAPGHLVPGPDENEVYVPCPACTDGGGRKLYTTGSGWPSPWIEVNSWESLFRVRHGVLLVDEIHGIAPSGRGVLSAEEERKLMAWLSLCRKRHVDVLATTQAWTRVSTHVRQLVGTVWLCEPIKKGKLHRATAHDIPEDGGAEVWAPQFFDPASARIPTNAVAWCAVDTGEDDDWDDDTDGVEALRQFERSLLGERGAVRELLDVGARVLSPPMYVGPEEADQGWWAS